MTSGAVELVIFDCDGVLLNTEEIASGACVEALARLGMHLTLHEYAARYSGRPVAEAWRQVEADYGRALPAGFRQTVDAEVNSRFRDAIAPIEGVRELLDWHTKNQLARRCVASSTNLPDLEANLAQAGLSKFFAPSIFSVAQVRRGKPAPDVFLFAASQMGADPARCLVIEDSIAGVSAARRAGMRVIGFSGGAHTTSGHDARLLEHGAATVVATMADLRELLQSSTTSRR